MIEKNFNLVSLRLELLVECDNLNDHLKAVITKGIYYNISKI